VEEHFDLFRGGDPHGLVLVSWPPVPQFQRTGQPIPVETTHLTIIYVIRGSGSYRVFKEFQGNREIGTRYTGNTWYGGAQGVSIGEGGRGEAKPIEGAADFEPGELGPSGALGTRGEFEDGGDVAEVAGLVAVSGEEDGVADEAAGGGEGEGGEGGGGNEDGAAAAGEVEAGEAVDLGLPIRFFGEGEVGGVGEGFGEGGVPLAGELGEQLVADAVAGEIKGGVGGVFAPGDCAVAEEANDLGAFDLDERADDAAARDGADGGESGGAAAAEEAEEDRFGLVGAGVAEGDAGG